MISTYFAIACIVCAILGSYLVDFATRSAAFSADKITFGVIGWVLIALSVASGIAAVWLIS